MGDGTLMEFASVVDAVDLAVDVQNAMAERNWHLEKDQRIVLHRHQPWRCRIRNDDIFGDGVDVAARLVNAFRTWWHL